MSDRSVLLDPMAGYGGYHLSTLANCYVTNVVHLYVENCKGSRFFLDCTNFYVRGGIGEKKKIRRLSVCPSMRHIIRALKTWTDKEESNQQHVKEKSVNTYIGLSDVLFIFDGNT